MFLGSANDNNIYHLNNSFRLESLSGKELITYFNEIGFKV
jgi:hypothetical protein